jgi:hypothetical protein
MITEMAYHTHYLTINRRGEMRKLDVMLTHLFCAVKMVVAENILMLTPNRVSWN